MKYITFVFFTLAISSNIAIAKGGLENNSFVKKIDDYETVRFRKIQPCKEEVNTLEANRKFITSGNKRIGDERLGYPLAPKFGNRDSCLKKISLLTSYIIFN